MNLWKSFERLLPARLRRTDQTMPDREYMDLFARITETDPTWRAVMEFGRHKFHQRCVAIQAMPPGEARTEAVMAMLDLAGFLNELEQEAAAQRQRQAELQRTAT